MTMNSSRIYEIVRYVEMNIFYCGLQKEKSLSYGFYTGQKQKKILHFFNLEGGLLEKHHLVLTTHKKIISPRPPSSPLREEERFRGIWDGGEKDKV